MRNIKWQLLLLAIIGFFHSSKAQVSFDHYIPLQSKGPVPADFSKETSQKIREDKQTEIPTLSKKEQKVFIEQVNYNIDELLKSGLVTYGDEVTTYIQKIGDRLADTDPELKGKLRFYTLNANEANAFSTNQGMVFVTTGLIAQMTNEAQLAFVLAHEIIHYREKHVLDLYDYASDNKSLSYDEKVRFFTKYSRDNEFEADKEGVKLVHAAGYASSEIVKTFDVLIYSYLPFEEVVFDHDYFNSPLLYVPEKLFKKQKVEISAKQKYNDRLTTHPNVAKRIEALEAEIAKFTGWGQILNYPGQSFDEVRSICRFESLLNDVYEDKTIDALYSIYLLEKEHPGSRFLDYCKSQVWLEELKEEKSSYGFDNYYSFGSFDGNAGFYEGEISVLSQVYNSIPSEGKVAMGLRFIRDAYIKDTLDPVMRKMWKKAIETVAFNSQFELKQYSPLNFQEAVAKVEEEKRLSAADTATVVRPNWDKYETIKNQRSGLTVDSGIDSTKFYLYAISDLVKDSVFQKEFALAVQKAKDEELKEDDFYTLSDEEQSDIEEEKFDDILHLGLDKVLLINPLVTEFKKYEQVDFPGSEELEEKLLNAVRKVSSDLGVVVNQLDRTALNTMTTQQYNDLSLIMRSMEKAVSETKPDVFILDIDRLDSLKLVYGSSKVMLISLSHSYAPNIGPGKAILYTILFPIGLVYFPIAILSGHQTEMNIYIMDLDKGEMVVDKSYYSNDQVSEKMLRSRLDALFHQLKKQPSNAAN